MRIAVGLPNTVPGTPGPRLTEWARRAEELGFSTLGTIGRLVFPTYDEFQALTAAAAVTTRIRLFSNVAIGPVYDRAFLAKWAAGLDQISGGRFVLGLGVGWRDEDFIVAGKAYKDRGRRLDADIEYLQRAWRGELVAGATKRLTPRPTNGEGVPLAFGGTVPASFERAALYGIGWTAGGVRPEDATAYFEMAREAWSKAGRDGAPYLWALNYFVLGAGGRETATTYLSDYYGDRGPGMAQGIPADAEAIRERADAFEAVGADELVFVPVSSDMAQLELLAEALGHRLGRQLEGERMAVGSGI
jgi:alkanesulfonate monooxygenase SsuD/methylene tetrahydromethanopterin reductase-like flavin-dependent oxidoreductase (luciferase family)